MANSTILLPADPSPSGRELRSYRLGPNAADPHLQYVIPTHARNILAQYMFSTFRIAGLASANHNLFYIKNTHATKLVGVRRLSIQVDSTAALATVAPIARTYKLDTGTQPTGGTASTKQLFDSSLNTVDAAITIMGAASADGTASAITWSVVAGAPGWSQMMDRQQTAAGFIMHDDQPLIPRLCEDEPLILRQNQSVVVQINIAWATTTSYTINGVAEEFTLL